MLLVSCPGCHVEISGRPVLCPNCGTALGEADVKQSKICLKIGKILAGFGIALVIWSMTAHTRSSLWHVGWLAVIIGLILTICAQYALQRHR